MKTLREEVLTLSNDKPLEENFINTLGNIAAGGLLLCSIPVAYAEIYQFIDRIKQRKFEWGNRKLQSQAAVDNFAENSPENRDGLVSLMKIAENSPQANLSFYVTSNLIKQFTKENTFDFDSFGKKYSSLINQRAKDLRETLSINNDVKKVAKAIKKIDVLAAFFVDLNNKQAKLLKQIVEEAVNKYFGDYTVKVNLVYNYKTWEKKYGQSLK